MKRKTLIATLLHDALQKRSKESTRSQAARFAVGLMRGSVLGGVFAISSLAIPANTVSAGTPCDTYIPSCDCGQCEIQAPICGCGKCGKSKLFRHNPLYRTLDTLAGGIEKVLGLDQCEGGSSCDDSCDSGNWMMSAQPMLLMAQPSMSAPIPVPLVPAAPLKSPQTTPPQTTPPQLPTVPPLETEPNQPREFQPEVLKPRISQPRIVAPKAEPARELEPLRTEPLRPLPSQPDPQPQAPIETTGPTPRMTAPRIVPGESPASPSEQATDALELPPAKSTPGAKPTPKKEGSLFDALDDLDDPFSEDAARLSEPYQQIRPTGYRSSGIPRHSYRPVYPLPAKTQRHVQPNHKVIGSGLRPADRVELLRRVSHEQPIEPQAAVGRRVLAPYRASR